MTHPFRWRLLLALLAVGPVAAWAHGGLPETSNITVRRNHAEDLFVGTTFGAVISRDSGQTWRWICPEAMAYNGWRPLAFTWQEGGELLAATGSALIRSRDAGCTWAAHPFFASTWVAHLAEHPTNERILYVATGKPASPNAIYRSEDGGETWSVTGLRREGVIFTSVLVSPVDPQRLYASGYAGDAQLLYRSEDAGATWTEIPQPLAQYIRPYDLVLMKASPTSADVLWVRMSATDKFQGFSYVLRSDDGGRTLTEVLKLEDVLVDAETSADGRTVWVSTPIHLYRSRNGEAFTTLTLPEGNACTKRVGDTLYGCGSAWVHTWALGRSTDEGTTWQPMMELSGIQGTHQCPAGTPTRQLCPSIWPSYAEVFGAPVPPPEPEPAPDAGTPDVPATPPASDGCGATSGVLPYAALLLALTPRRRRPTHPEPRP